MELNKTDITNRELREIHMHHRRSRLLIPLCAVLLLATVACGSDKKKTSGGGKTGDKKKTELADLSGTSLEVAAVWTGTEQKNFRKVLDAFEKKTGAKVKYTPTGDDIAAALGPRLAAKKPPDAAIVPQPALFQNYAKKGNLQPLDDVVGDAYSQNYADIWKKLATVDGKIYGVWFKAANKSLVWYNTKPITDAGVEPPKDWDGFVKALQTVSDSGITPLSVGGADGWTLTDWFENVYLSSAGPEKYDQLTQHKIPWTDPSVKTALGLLAKVFTKDFMAGGSKGALSTDFNTSVTQVFAKAPKAALVFEADFVAGVIRDETKAKVGTDAKNFAFPATGSGDPSVVGGGDVAVLMKKSKGGEELMKFLASPEAGAVWAKLGGFISPNKSLDTGAYPDDIAKSIAENLLTAADKGNFRFDLSDQVPTEFGGTPGRGLFKLLQDFVANPSDVDGITKQLESAAAKAQP